MDRKSLKESYRFPSVVHVLVHVYRKHFSDFLRHAIKQCFGKCHRNIFTGNEIDCRLKCQLNVFKVPGCLQKKKSLLQNNYMVNSLVCGDMYRMPNVAPTVEIMKTHKRNLFFEIK